MKSPLKLSLSLGLVLLIAATIHASQPTFYSTNGFGPGFYVDVKNGLTVNLTKYIQATPGTDTNFVYVSTSLGGFGLKLRPDRAPKTVSNFLSYVRNGSYGNTFIHRSIDDFVLQAGGYSLNAQLTPIQSLRPVPSEFSIRNTAGTVAMALVGTNSNSATSQWFINLSDNTSILDNTNTNSNPPFTVFAQIQESDMSNTVLKIQTNTSVYDLTYFLSYLPWSSAFSSLPLITNTVDFSSFVSVRVSEIPFFAYSSDPDSFSTKLEGGNLRISFKGYPTNNPTSFTYITAGATDTNGLSTNATFVVVPTIKGNQTISFPNIPDVVFNATHTNSFYIRDFPTSSSTVPVILSIISGPVVVATNLAQKTDITSLTPLKATNIGTVVFEARTYSNNAVGYSYNPATPVRKILSVKPQDQSISPFPPILTQVYGNPPFIIYPPTSDSGLKVNVTVKSGPATIINNLVTIKGAGTVTLAANQPGDTLVASAPEVTTSFVISKAEQGISFPAIPDHRTTDKPFTITLPSSSASAKIPVSLSISGPAQIRGKTIALTGTSGVVSLVARAQENANYNSKTVTNSFTVLP